MAKKKTSLRLEIEKLVALKLDKKQFRLLGILPLAFFIAQAIHYWQINQLGHMLWMCNIGNLLLAIGLFFEQVVLIRVAVLWAVPGLAVWAAYVVPTWGMLLTGEFRWSEFYGVVSSTLAHVGGLSVALVALQRIRMERGVWFYAFIWYFIVQLLSRLLTPAAMNVNLSHRIQDRWEPAFSAYWKFWIMLSFLVGICMWLLAFLLERFWPRTIEVGDQSSETSSS